MQNTDPKQLLEAILQAISDGSDDLADLVSLAAKASSNFVEDFHTGFSVAIDCLKPDAVEIFLKNGMPANMTIEGKAFTAEDLEKDPEQAVESLRNSFLYNVMKREEADPDPLQHEIAMVLVSYGAITNWSHKDNMVDLSSIAASENDWPLATALCRIGVLPMNFMINLLRSTDRLPAADVLADFLEAIKDLLEKIAADFKKYAPKIKDLKLFVKSLEGPVKVILGVVADDRVQLLGHSILAAATVIFPEALPVFSAVSGVLHAFGSEGTITKVLSFVKEGVFDKDSILGLLMVAENPPGVSQVMAWDKLIDKREGNEGALQQLFSVIWDQLMPKTPLSKYL